MICKHPRPWRLLPLAVALAALLLPAHPLHAAMSTFNAANWAGYVVEYTGGGSTPQNGVANSVSASWTVPTAAASIQPSASGSYCQCAVWIGIDGFSNGSLVQLGTDSIYQTGTTNYYAWYEVLPNLPHVEFGVSPGDSITASIQYNPPGNPGTFLLSLTDNTKNVSFPTTYVAGSSAPRSSADWIVEAPNGSGGFAPLPNFGSATFTGASATLGTESGPVDNPDWETWYVLMKSTTKSNPVFADAAAPTLPIDIGTDGSATSSFVVNQVAPEPSSVALTVGMAATTGGIVVASRWRRRKAKRYSHGK